MKKFFSFAVYALLSVFATLSLSACWGGDDDNEDDVVVLDKTRGNGMDNGHAYIDLGLPSGVKWADCNIGASRPEVYGNYVAWGEKAVKTSYDWSTYEWGSNFDQLTKYCNKADYGKDGFSDNKLKLDLEDDIAHVYWGGRWRTPTITDIYELINKTKSEWVENYNNTEVSGYLFTGTNGNQIFLPAAGYRDGAKLKSAGSYGDYWSSNLYSSGFPARANLLGFGPNDLNVYYKERYFGLTVRPVRP